jgi:hypothetical protein
MEDLLVALLGGIAELLLEACLEIGAGLLVSLLFRLNKRVLLAALRLGRTRAFLAFSMLGAIVGLLDVLIWPHRLFQTSHFHGASLLISPLIAGFVMLELGRSLRRLERRSIPLETFWLGFAFAFAMALTRFALVK